MTFVFIFIVLNCNIAICYTIYSKKWLKLNQLPINEGRELMSRMLILIIILFSIDLCGKFAMKQLCLRINKRETLWMNQPKCIIEIVYPCKSASWIWFLHYKHKHSSAFTLIFPVAFRLIHWSLLFILLAIHSFIFIFSSLANHINLLLEFVRCFR